MNDLREALEEVGGMLSMTRCPYFLHGGTCDRGCHSEPQCVTDAPVGGWVEGALAVLNQALDEDDAA